MANDAYKRYHKPNMSEKATTQQGYYKITNIDKYMDKNNPVVIYRSSWEFKLCRWCEVCPSVIRWSSEPIAIPYYDRVTNLNECVKLGLDPNNPVNWKKRNYNIDFYIEIITGKTPQNTPIIEKWLIEVKPAYKLEKPIQPNKNAKLKDFKRYNNLLKEYLINEAKFAAAKQYANKIGGKFHIFTEDVLKKLGILRIQ
ncbi:MAG: TnsA endonuclease N-terminal domain-containing protein [Clostridia bacterium]